MDKTDRIKRRRFQIMENLLAGMDWTILFWLACMVVFIVAELITVGLTSIWFAAGVLIALLFAVSGVNFAIQIVAFVVISLVLLAATRPWAKKFVNAKFSATNADSLIGSVISIRERVSNLDQTGSAVVNGQEWTVRTDDDNVVIEEGELAKVVRITGVKLIVEKKKEE